MCIVKNLNDFREPGMDPDNDGVTENNRDKRPSVPITNEKLVIWMQNNPKLQAVRGTESSESAKKKTFTEISSVDRRVLHLNFGIAASRARILENSQVSASRRVSYFTILHP